MYKLCKTEQSAARQHKIEQTLLEMMGNWRYEEITVSNLCGRMGIPRKSFYRYFGGKDDVLYALIDHRLMEYETRYGGIISREKPGSVLNLNWFFEFWMTQKDLLDALERSKISGILVERAVQNSQRAEIFAYAPKSYSRADLEMVTSFVVCGLMSIVLRWHQQGYHQSAGEMAQTAYKMLNRPMIPGLEL